MGRCDFRINHRAGSIAGAGTGVPLTVREQLGHAGQGLIDVGTATLKGFDEPVALYEVRPG